MSSDDYNTDDWLMSLFKDWFDPCTLSDGELRSFDGLGSSWGGRTFVNPPYSDPLPWVKKAIEESKKGKTIVLLLKMDTSTKWFTALQEAGAHFLWINGRLKHKTGKPANFPSMLAILNKEVL
jgi:site-specific DNA-methyltransferase (adenine-specific)